MALKLWDTTVVHFLAEGEKCKEEEGEGEGERERETSRLRRLALLHTGVSVVVVLLKNGPLRAVEASENLGALLARPLPRAAAPRLVALTQQVRAERLAAGLAVGLAVPKAR